MKFEFAEEAEYLEQENQKQNVALAKGDEIVIAGAVVKIEPVAEVAKIIEFKDRIATYMAPALEEELKGIVAVSQEITKVTSKKDREEAQKQATACQKGRTQKVEAPFDEFKAPVTAVGKLFDARKRTLMAIVKPEEDRIRGLIAAYDKIEEDRLKAIEEERRRKISERIQRAMQAGVVVDSEFAEIATDEEWEISFMQLVEEKTRAELKAKEEVDRKIRIQKQIASRFEIASKLGAVISLEDAELLDDVEFDALQSIWKAEHDAREDSRRSAEEQDSFRSRAADMGFALDYDTLHGLKASVIAGTHASLTIAFDCWLGECLRERDLERERKLLAERLEIRMAQVEELGITAPPLSFIRTASEEEWSAKLFEQTGLKKEFAGSANHDVTDPVVAIPEVAVKAVAAITETVRQGGIPKVEEIKTVVDSIPQAGSEDTAELLELYAMVADVKESIEGIFEDFKKFGNTHCADQKGILFKGFMPIFVKLKTLKTRL